MQADNWALPQGLPHIARLTLNICHALAHSPLQSRSPLKPGGSGEELASDDMANVINDGLAYYEQELQKVGGGGGRLKQLGVEQ